MLRKEKLEASPLEAAPEVNALLRRLGLGTLDGDGISAFAGRNNNWAGRTSTGAAVFVKRLDGDREESLVRFGRALDFQAALLAHPSDDLRCPPLLGADEEGRLLVFAWLDDARAGNVMATDGEFEPDLAYLCGRAIGALHRLPAAADTTPHPLPPVWALQAIPLTMFSAARIAELRYWGLLQRDRPLVAALEALRERESLVEHRPSHSDLRLDQFLLDSSGLHVLDWEEFRMADPARDVGAFAGEWLHHAIRKVNSDVDKVYGPGTTLSHELIVERGSAEIARVRPLIAEFWRGYLDSGVDVDDDLTERSTAYAGWHLLDRLLATAGTQTRLRAIDLAAAGIGRTALLNPGRFTETLGLAAPSRPGSR
ncbi:class V lanthionine synthetase subunit LxmK [Nonomuraea jiangxiensis]|uniref:Predicted kinase, aminoglycoside phosphotransferase (APT) family n=1 Tax=Nonomuraea jiangxiensis TaxID=633440 RepID=A0A1G9CPD4_9ACTN|nr:class V lanthionine synthetase subunit LxmK [Nonomuraea jiangxiensis]SDK53295.1 Predicted kinase, aminoglycoside phosphotransferase (APT) family [Nonomuraea jiangxiensis]